MGLWGLWPAVKPHRNLDFRRCRESPRPGAGLLFRKEAKARAVLGLAEPVHPLPHLPRQSRLFGRHSRLHPSCGGRGILFEYRAADWNPALALRMRAMGSSEVRGDAIRAANAVVSAGAVAQSAGWWASMAERYAAVIPAGVVGASRRRRTAIEERFLGLRSLRRCG